MRPALLLLPPLMAVLVGCVSSPSPSSPPTSSESPDRKGSTVPTSSSLTASHWRLVEAVDADGKRIDALFPSEKKAFQLDFSPEGLSVSGGCNGMHGRWRIEGGRLVSGPLAQTQMYCNAPGLMAADEAIAARLGAPGPAVSLQDGRLQLLASNGDRLTFEGTPTAETRYGGPGERVFLEVAAQRVACSHPLIPDYRCLHVRELSYDGQGLKTATGDWQFLYQDIEGYQHQPGVRNVLRLKRFQVSNPPADGSSVAYVHDMTVESETVAP